METQNMPDRVYVVPDAVRFDVVPPAVFLHQGSSFKVSNFTQWTIRVSCPKDVVDPPIEQDIPPDGEFVFTVSGAAKRGAYRYRVRVVIIREDRANGVQEFSLDAVGSSDPRIIID